MGLVTTVEQHRHGRKRPPFLFESRCDLHHGAAGLQRGETFPSSHAQKPYQGGVAVGISGEERRQQFGPVRLWLRRGVFQPEQKLNRLGGRKMRQVVFPQIVDTQRFIRKTRQ